MTRVAVNGVQLNVEQRGAGPALLLLHGFTGSGATWTPHLEAWHGFTTVAVDLLGHGEQSSRDGRGRAAAGLRPAGRASHAGAAPRGRAG